MIPHFSKIKKVNFQSNPVFAMLSIVLVLFITGFLVYSNIKINQRKADVQNQISKLQEEINSFKQKNDELKFQISKGAEQEYIERVARQDLGLQKQGETVVGFILPPPQDKTSENQKFWQAGSLLGGIKDAWNWLLGKF